MCPLFKSGKIFIYVFRAKVTRWQLPCFSYKPTGLRLTTFLSHTHYGFVMETQQPVDGHSFPLLKLPREIRDLIYGEVLLDLPTPSLESLLDRLASHMATATSESLPIGGDDEGHVVGEENEGEERLQMRERNVVRAFRSEARAFSKDSLKIDTNILLACRQTFAEAKQLLLRRGRFVKVISTNIGLTRLMFASQLCWIDARYSNFAIMTYFCKHHLARHSYLPSH